jgi:hypothetical protein
MEHDRFEIVHLSVVHFDGDFVLDGRTLGRTPGLLGWIRAKPLEIQKNWLVLPKDW